MSLGFRHLVWNRAHFSGSCWATARLTYGAVPLALDAAAACWCRSPHGLTSVSPASPPRVSCPARVPPPVAAFRHGLSLQGPVVLCAHLCPVLSVSEACASEWCPGPPRCGRLLPASAPALRPFRSDSRWAQPGPLSARRHALRASSALFPDFPPPLPSSS